MFPGPVFSVELLTTARRSRYYALRTLYGMLLLLILWISYREFVETHGEGQVFFAPNEMASFARQTFVFFAIMQGLVVLAITPALVGGTIAGEKQRKTLHYLLASQLSSREIVFGKLFARMLMIFVFLIAGVPFLFLLRLFGGVESSLILICFGTTVSFALFLASMSIFFSTIMRRARSAIIATYVTMLVLLFMPLIARMFEVLFFNNSQWLMEITDWISPIISPSEIERVMFQGYVQTSIIRMVVAQILYSTLFLIYSTWRLRAIAANQTNTPKKVLRLDSRGRPSWRPIPRPSVADDPMMWKERYTSRVGGWAKMLGLLNNLFWATLIGCMTFEYARTSILEIIHRGGFEGHGNVTNRQEFLAVIQFITPWVAGFWILGAATTAAASIASEREDDTWISLIATDLEGREIIRAKILGSIMRFRWIGLMLLIVWLVGVIGGAVHPVSFVIACLELAIFLFFAASLGVRCSLTSNSTSKSLANTLGILLTMNGGYLLCCIPIPSFQTNVATAGVMPYILSQGLFSAENWSHYNVVLTTQAYQLRGWASRPTLPGMVAIALYSSLGCFLTWRSIALFDVVVDRPRPGFDSDEAVKQKPPVRGHDE